MSVDKQELRRLAADAIVGHWFKSGDLRYSDDKTGEVHGLNVEDDRFIAAANPDAILALLDELEQYRKDAERRVPLYEAVERACEELPDGWTVQLHMEKGAGWVELYDDCGVHCDDFPTDNERLDYTLNDAIDAAIEAYK